MSTGGGWQPLASLQPATPLPFGPDRIAHISDCGRDLCWGGVREILGNDLVEQAINSLDVVQAPAVSQHRIDDQYRQLFIVGVHGSSLNPLGVEV